MSTAPEKAETHEYLLLSPNIAGESLKCSVSPDGDVYGGAGYRGWAAKKIKVVSDDEVIKKKEKKEKFKEEIIEYLKGKLSLKEGYPDFRDAKGKKLYGLDIVRQCKFTSDFINEHDNRFTSPIHVSVILSLRNFH